MQNKIERARVIGVGRFLESRVCSVRIEVPLRGIKIKIGIRFEFMKKTAIDFFTFLLQPSGSSCHGHGSS
jgi:hypothetical protein